MSVSLPMMFILFFLVRATPYFSALFFLPYFRPQLLSVCFNVYAGSFVMETNYFNMTTKLLDHAPGTLSVIRKKILACGCGLHAFKNPNICTRQNWQAQVTRDELSKGWHSMTNKSADSGPRLPGFNSQLRYLFLVWLWKLWSYKALVSSSLKWEYWLFCSNFVNIQWVNIPRICLFTIYITTYWWCLSYHHLYGFQPPNQSLCLYPMPWSISQHIRLTYNFIMYIKFNVTLLLSTLQRLPLNGINNYCWSIILYLHHGSGNISVACRSPGAQRLNCLLTLWSHMIVHTSSWNNSFPQALIT